MHFFLAKTEPGSYSIENLEADGKTLWDGVRNPQALRAIREMHAGDRVFIYHSGGESAIVGLAKVASAPRADPSDEKLAVVDFAFLQRLDPPTTLKEIKETHRFDDWSLVKQSRLSTMAVPETFVAWMRERYPDAKL
jgi:predicted RNA-binding protein with PUA-like domain